MNSYRKEESKNHILFFYCGMLCFIAATLFYVEWLLPQRFFVTGFICLFIAFIEAMRLVE